jgi:branched-chain amino acid transport system substrate-binding protein
MTSSKRRGRSAAVLASVLALSLLAASCGSDDDDGGSGAATTASAATTAAAATTAGGSATTAGGAGTTAASGPATGEPYKVGFTSVQSGPQAFLGTNQLAGLEAALDYINEHGGANGRPIEVVSMDDGADAARGIANIRSLAGEGVLAIFAAPQTQLLEAEIPAGEAAKITLFSAGTHSKVLVPPMQWVFGLDIPPPAEAPTELEFAQELLGKQDITVGLIAADTPASEEWMQNVQKLADASGATVLNKEKIPIQAADVTAQAQGAIRNDPEVILSQAAEGGLATLVPKLRDLGYDGPIVNYHGGGSADFLKQMNDPELYVARTTAPISDDPEGKPGLEQFIAATEAAGTVSNANANVLYGIGYLFGLIAQAGLEKCGDDCSAEQLNEVYQEFELDTEGFTFAPVSYSADDHQGLDSEVFYHWQDGEYVAAADGKVFVGQLPVV